MIFEQHVTDCDEHEDCTAIVGVQDGTEVWVSHLSSTVHPEHRLNLDYPTALDLRPGGAGKVLRWSLPCDDCMALPGSPWTAESRRELIDLAEARGLRPHGKAKRT